MSRHQKSLENSSLYRSTIDNIVREDNEQSVTEDLKVSYTFSVIPFHTIFTIVNYYCLQKSVDEHGKYISAHQQGLKTRHRLTMGGLAVLVVVIVAIIAAFTAALCWKAHNIEEIEGMLSDTRDECDNQVARITQDVQVYKNEIHELEQQLNRKIQEQALKITEIENCRYIRYCRNDYRGGREFQGRTEAPFHRVYDRETVGHDDNDDQN